MSSVNLRLSCGRRLVIQSVSNNRSVRPSRPCCDALRSFAGRLLAPAGTRSGPRCGGSSSIGSISSFCRSTAAACASVGPSGEDGSKRRRRISPSKIRNVWPFLIASVSSDASSKNFSVGAEVKAAKAKVKEEGVAGASAASGPTSVVESAAAVVKGIAGGPVSISSSESPSSVSEKIKKKRALVDSLPSTSVDRNFITAIRAMSDFLLKPSDLDGLRKTRRRSPFELEPPIVVFWRKDVEQRAMDVWGDMKKIDEERLRRSRDYALRKKNLFHLKRMLKEYDTGGSSDGTNRPGPTHALEKVRGSKRVVFSAIVINFANCVFKALACFYTGSYSLFSEALHSLADTLNQCILAVGIFQSEKKADRVHPYGYTNAKYVASLISGVGIFCLGAGLSIYHGIEGLFHAHVMENVFWAYLVLGVSMVAEGGTLVMAIKSIHKGAKERGVTFYEYVIEARDPTVNVVLLEDAAAVLGVVIAASCMGLTTFTGSHIPDAVGSLMVGSLLGAIAMFIINTNSNALVGRSISPEKILEINQVLEEDVMVRAIHDVKGIDMGNDLVRYKAEVDIDGRQLTRRYLNSQDLERFFEEIQQMQTIEELEAFLLKHGENIVDLLGAEIDRIEQKLKARFPELRHVDLEVL